MVELEVDSIFVVVVVVVVVPGGGSCWLLCSCVSLKLFNLALNLSLSYIRSFEEDEDLLHARWISEGISGVEVELVEEEEESIFVLGIHFVILFSFSVGFKASILSSFNSMGIFLLAIGLWIWLDLVVLDGIKDEELELEQEQEQELLSVLLGLDSISSSVISIWEMSDAVVVVAVAVLVLVIVIIILQMIQQPLKKV